MLCTPIISGHWLMVNKSLDLSGVWNVCFSLQSIAWRANAILRIATDVHSYRRVKLVTRYEAEPEVRRKRQPENMSPNHLIAGEFHVMKCFFLSISTIFFASREKSEIVHVYEFICDVFAKENSGTLYKYINININI